MNPCRNELPGLGNCAIIESMNDRTKNVVAIGTTDDTMCVTDPFSSGCGRFKVDPTKEWGVTREQVKNWWEAVKMCIEDEDFDESSLNAPNDYIEAYLAGGSPWEA